MRIKKKVTMGIPLFPGISPVTAKWNLKYYLQNVFWLMFLALLLSSCASPPVVEPPSWWNNPKRDDSWAFFQTASSENCLTQEAAMQQAYDAALARMSKRLVAKISTKGGKADIKTDFLFKNVKRRDAHSAEVDGKWSAWILIEYPVEEYNKQVSYLTWPIENFREAMQLKSAKNYASAIRILKEILIKYPPGEQNVFRSEKAILELARISLAQNRKCAAEAYYKKLLATSSTNSAVLAAAKRELKEIGEIKPQERVSEKLAGHKVALYCTNTKTGDFYKHRQALGERLKHYHIDIVLLDDEKCPNDAEICEDAREEGASYVLIKKLKIIPDFKPFPGSKYTQCLVYTQWKFLSAKNQLLGSGHFTTKWNPKHETPDKMAAIVGVNVLVIKKMPKEIKWEKEGN